MGDFSHIPRPLSIFPVLKQIGLITMVSRALRPIVLLNGFNTSLLDDYLSCSWLPYWAVTVNHHTIYIIIYCLGTVQKTLLGWRLFDFCQQYLSAPSEDCQNLGAPHPKIVRIWVLPCINCLKTPMAIFVLWPHLSYFSFFFIITVFDKIWPSPLQRMAKSPPPPSKASTPVQ